MVMMQSSVMWQVILSGISLFLLRGAVALVVLAVFYFLADGAGNLVERLASLRDLELSLIRLFGRMARTLVNVIGCIVALGTVGIDASALVAGVGLVGLAIGLAMKEVLSNLLAGIMVLAYKPFKENDRIAVTTFEGRVSEINLRFTTLESGGKRIFIPNALVISNAVVVDKAPGLSQPVQAVRLP